MVGNASLCRTIYHQLRGGGMDFISKMFDEDLKELAELIAERQGYKITKRKAKDSAKKEENNSAD